MRMVSIKGSYLDFKWTLRGLRLDARFPLDEQRAFVYRQRSLHIPILRLKLRDFDEKFLASYRAWKVCFRALGGSKLQQNRLCSLR